MEHVRARWLLAAGGPTLVAVGVGGTGAGTAVAATLAAVVGLGAGRALLPGRLPTLVLAVAAGVAAAGTTGSPLLLPGLALLWTAPGLALRRWGVGPLAGAAVLGLLAPSALVVGVFVLRG